MGRNSNLTVPQGLSNQDRRFAEGIKENLDVILGHRGDPLQRAVTFQDLLDANIIELARGINLFGSTNDIVPVVNEIPNLDIPPAPTSLQASGAFQNIVLTWNLSLYRGHSFVEVFRHTSDSISSATMVAQVSGFTGVYADAVGGGQTFYYWVRAVNENGVLGPFNSSTGTQGQTAPDIGFLLTTLADSITSSQLASSLSDPIGNLPANTASSITNLETEQNAQGVTIASQATSITNLNTTVGDNSASISTQATSIDGLEAQYTVKIDNNGAVAGYGLASTTTGSGNIVSEFIVNADRFAIMRGGSNTATATVPFVVQASATTLNGETVPAGVYMADAFIKNGSIASAKIGTLAVDKLTGTMSQFETQIAGTISTSRLNIDGSTLTSSGGVLQVNEINANKVTAGTLSSSRLLLDGVTIDTDGAGRVIIKDLGVNTLQIAGNAVTVPTAAFTAASVTLNYNQGEVTVQTISYTASGVPVLLTGAFVAIPNSGRSHRVRAQIKQTFSNGTSEVVLTQRKGGSGSGTGHHYFNLTVTHTPVTAVGSTTPATGTVTYILTYENLGVTAQAAAIASTVSDRHLSGIEVKK